ncbi:MAG: hypothetical protein JW940_03470 [Polyangiaceae bacterium]|nr:hypothetical protein [Polyangiaceae bacterium]
MVKYLSLAPAVCALAYAQPARAQATPPVADEPPGTGVAPETGAVPVSAAASQSPSGAAQQKEPSLAVRLNALETRFDELSSELESEAVERLVQDAQNEARAAEAEARPEEREFLEGGLALQKLNPELTACGDVVAAVVVDGKKFYATESDRSGLFLRGLGVHLQHVLDPYSMFKSALHFSPEHGVGLEELYVSWFGLIPTTSFAVGRFRQNFGILNRWHEHDLDQSSYPLALRLVLGDEGLIGDGLMFRWLMPSLWAHANELTIEVVDGSNETLYAGAHFSVPSTLAHLKNYYDLSSSTYLELGLTGMFGFNNRRGLLDDQDELVDEPWRRTVAAGADLTLYWSPLNQAKYRSFTWRSELYFASKERPEQSPHRWSKSTGVYSYVQDQLSERWFVGVRGDVVRPTVRASRKLAWDIVPYVTFWQSEFVYLRLEAQHGRNLPYVAGDGTLDLRTDNRALLQIDFAAGPHKHEKY